ncbi:MAG TPA: hypothetical protein VF473_03355, partial [Cyclobacteriaceae bacterium]
MKNIIAVMLSIVAMCSFAQTAPSADNQIKTALLASPAASKEGAMVYGYNDKLEFVVLRKGTNEMVCIADDPKQEGFSASCYQKDLEPFMERGRELKKQGKSPREIL